jgi:hypothetical protein
LHLQDYSRVIFLYMSVWGLPCQAYRPLAVASRATLLDRLRYVRSLEVILVRVGTAVIP